MGETTQTREVTPLTLRADVVPGSLNEEARTVEVVWTTGARVKRFDWFDGPFWEELSTDPKHVRMGRLESGRAPVLLQHNSWNPDAHQGVVERATIKTGQGTATLRFLKDDEDADKTWNKIRQGVLTSVSVGYSVHRVEETKGTDGMLPVRKAVDWEPYEISPVSMPADPAAHMRSESRRTNPCEFITRGEAPQKETKMADETKPPAPVVLPTRTQEQIDANAAEVRAQLAERERVLAINTLAREHGVSDAARDSFVSTGATLDAVRKAILEEKAKRSDEAPIQGNHRITGGEDSRDKRLRGMAAWLFERSGKTEMLEQARGHKRFGRHFSNVEFDGGEFRGMSLVDIAREFLEQRKPGSTRGLDRMTLVGRAFTERGGGLQTTSDFAALFENVMHKILLAAYATAPDTWRLFCGTDTVSDFRAHNRFRTGSFGVLDTLNEHGEYKNKQIPDGQKQTITTETRGNIIGFTREMVINDDMGAFANLAAMFGRAGGLSIEVAVYALLTANSGLGPTMSDTNPFFHSGRANVNASGSALGVSGIDADRVVMAQQKDISSNEYLDLRPSILVLPIGLGGEARVINDSQYDVDSVTTNATNKFMKPNKVRGLFRTIVDSPRLTGTRRYLFTDPSITPAIKVVFLEGSGESPILEQKETWRTDGTEYKVRMDFEAQVFDWKGAVTNAGA